MTENEVYIALYHNDYSLDFETDKHEYVWRPDQLRRDLKIEY